MMFRIIFSLIVFVNAILSSDLMFDNNNNIVYDIECNEGNLMEDDVYLCTQLLYPSNDQSIILYWDKTSSHPWIQYHIYVHNIETDTSRIIIVDNSQDHLLRIQDLDPGEYKVMIYERKMLFLRKHNMFMDSYITSLQHIAFRMPSSSVRITNIHLNYSEKVRMAVSAVIHLETPTDYKVKIECRQHNNNKYLYIDICEYQKVPEDGLFLTKVDFDISKFNKNQKNFICRLNLIHQITNKIQTSKELLI